MRFGQGSYRRILSGTVKLIDRSGLTEKGTETIDRVRFQRVRWLKVLFELSLRKWNDDAQFAAGLDGLLCKNAIHSFRKR